MWHMYGYGFNYAWLWMLGFSLIKILVVVGIAILFIKLINREHSYRNSSRALEILEERYVKGEISEEEYKHKKKILKS
ncbi:SHOCT domain-containing protein [Caloranaerobacter sp. DY30410]|uniref:SHOCT domain-containing protein n=1 Tax=Caloranaerobacter sp. DY30410 TaxID=3238305 RepID=UPI003CFE8A42